MAEKVKKQQVVVSLDADLRTALEELAKKEDRTLAAQVRSLIREAVTPSAPTAV